MGQQSMTLKCHYLVGQATLAEGDLAGFVDALNYLRDHGLVIWCGTYAREAVGIRVPLGLRCDSPVDPEDATAAVAAVADSARLTWKALRPRASSKESLRACARIDAAEGAGAIALADVTPADEQDDPFAGLVGMGEQKALLKDVGDAAAAFGRESLESLHMVFTGKSGVGKTELASRASRYFHKCGITNGTFVKATAADLIEKYVGSAPRLMRAAFDRAEGGVLFIDEAYALCQGRGNEFGVEAVNTLVECMDARRDRVIVICAGYPKEMDEFLSANPGLRERFGFVVRLDDYDAAQLAQIYEAFAEKKDFVVEEDARLTLAKACEGAMAQDNFCGARTVRKLFDRSVLNAAQAHPGRRVLEGKDIELAQGACGQEAATRRAIGFV